MKVVTLHRLRQCQESALFSFIHYAKSFEVFFSLNTDMVVLYVLLSNSPFLFLQSCGDIVSATYSFFQLQIP